MGHVGTANGKNDRIMTVGEGSFSCFKLFPEDLSVWSMVKVGKMLVLPTFSAAPGQLSLKFGTSKNKIKRL